MVTVVDRKKLAAAVAARMRVTTTVQRNLQNSALKRMTMG